MVNVKFSPCWEKAITSAPDDSKAFVGLFWVVGLAITIVKPDWAMAVLTADPTVPRSPEPVELT
jgi:hypothetical protein